jgi:hypothetical protein
LYQAKIHIVKAVVRSTSRIQNGSVSHVIRPPLIQGIRGGFFILPWEKPLGQGVLGFGGFCPDARRGGARAKFNAGGALSGLERILW